MYYADVLLSSICQCELFPSSREGELSTVGPAKYNLRNRETALCFFCIGLVR